MTVALIPAAGRSARLGQPKQLVLLDGEPLVRRAARVALEAGCARAVVVEGAVPLAAALEGLPRVELVRCEDWAKGPGASLRKGADHIGEDDVLVLLADQYRVGVDDLRALLAATGEVVAARYEGTLGVPVRFTARWSSVLRALPADAGAKGWLGQNAARLTPVELPSAAVDLDTPADLTFHR